MYFLCTSTFQARIKRFCKDKRQLILQNCDRFIQAFFEDYDNIHKLWELPNIRTMGDVKVIKQDIKNSDQRRGGRRSSRLIFLVDKFEDRVVLLYFFPKFGKEGIDDLSKADYKALLKTYSKEKQANQLITAKVFEPNKKREDSIEVQGVHFSNPKC